MNADMTQRDALEARLRKIGAERYHDKHPFHRLLHSGGCTHEQVQAWVINRYYYQRTIPLKDAAFMSRCEDPDMRRNWRSRIEDHDGGITEGGGLRRWLKLAEAVGLDVDYVASCEGVLPATKFAVDSYVVYVREKPLLQAVASSLTELFAPKIHEERIVGLLKHYDFANEDSMSYFKKRLTEAPRDVAYGLAWVLDHADTAEKEDMVADALMFKTDLLWAQLDALHSAYVDPGRAPPGGWRMGQGAA